MFDHEDLLYSGDIIERLEELENLVDENEPLDEDENEELKILQKVDKVGRDYIPDWVYGEILISDDYFEEYAQELSEDINGTSNEWPYYCIDWKLAAEQLQQDYTEIEIDGHPYWAR